MSKSFALTRITVSGCVLVAALVLYATNGPGAVAATLNAPVDFSDFAGNPSAESWTIGSDAGGPVSNAGRLGQGDHAVQYIPHIDRRGFHFHHVAVGGTPNADMLGDYTAAGVNAIQVDIRILFGDILTLRAYLFANPIGGLNPGPHAISKSTVVLDAINDNEWTTYTFPILADDLKAIVGSRAELLTRVSRIGFRHDPGGTGAGTHVPLVAGANVLFDNVVLRRLLPGDFNSDGLVDASDYTVWRDNLGASEPASLGGNGNNDGVVDMGDYQLWLDHYTSVSATANAANQVPEPAAFWLMGYVFGWLAVRCKRFVRL